MPWPSKENQVKRVTPNRIIIKHEKRHYLGENISTGERVQDALMAGVKFGRRKFKDISNALCTL